MKLNTLLLGMTIVLFSCQSGEDKESSSVTVESEVLPLREIKEVGVFITQIKADSVWFKSIEEKAKKQSISIDSMLIIDATFLQGQDAEIVKIENDIIHNPEWLASVKQKALDKKITLDEMIRSDAEFMFYQKAKQ